MKPTLNASKSIFAVALAAALVLVSPGLPAYQAFAGGFNAAPGAKGLPSGGAIPAFQKLSASNVGSAYAGLSIQGIQVGQVMNGLSSLDLSKPEQAARVNLLMTKLAALPAAASEEQILQTVADAARLSRQLAFVEIEAFRNADGSMDRVQNAVNVLPRYENNPLLTPALRQRAKVALVQARRELSRLRTAAAEKKIREGTSSWEKSGPGELAAAVVDVAAAALKAGAPALEKPSPKDEAAAPKQEPASRFQLDAPKASKKGLPWGRLAGQVSIAVGAALVIGAPALAVIAAGVVGSILLHEVAHLWALRRLGDDTAAAAGVTSLNPFKLVDPLKTVLLPMLSLAASHLLFGLPLMLGAAKPIPVDFNKLADPKRDAAKVALAGPAMNLVLAGAFFGLAALVPAAGAAAFVLGTLWKVNLALAAFNMLPLPQMDGGKVLVGLMPQKLYDKWITNKKVAPAYQSTFKKLYQGPSALLNAIGMTGQGQVNATTSVITWAVFGVFAAASYMLGGLPVLLLMLVCSYDYYCIREKIQNENATRALMDLMLGFANDIAQMAQEGFGIKSKINTEKVEHSLKNALEDTIDKVVDSDGFDGLSEEDKWKRLEASYMDAAVAALKREGMRHDDEATIRRVLESPRGRAFLDGIKAWVKEHEVFSKWHSEGRKKKIKDAVKGKLKEQGGKLMGLALIGLTGAQLGGGAFMLGTLDEDGADAPASAPSSFAEAMKHPSLQISPKQQDFLNQLISEMKFEEKPPVVGRVDELGKVYKNVTAPRGDINSVIIVGKAGTGKTAVPEKFAQAIMASEEKGGVFQLTKMQGRYLVKLNLARLLVQDDPAAALDALLALLSKFNDADKRTGNRVVLFVDEVHQLFAHAKGDQMANLLKEPMRDGSLSIIAATTEAEYKKYMENDEAFRRRMILIRMDEASIQETMRMLQGARGYYEGLYELGIEPEAMKAAAELSKYDQEQFLPGRAFKYLLSAAKEAGFDSRRDRASLAIADKMNDLQYVSDRLAEELEKTPTVTQKLKEDEPTTIELYNLAVKLTQELVALYRQRDAIPTEGRPVVTADLVKEEIAAQTGVGAGMLTLGQEPVDRYLKMEEELGRDVIGQDEAVHAVAEAVRRNKAGLSDPNLPIARLLFTGPTGSGKTHLAKKLAKFLFKDEGAVVRFDMSEFMEPHSVSKFTGSPPGYVGYAEGGQLTEAVRKKPYSVLLFDELEKAHPDVFDILLQILGDGRLTDGQGRTTDFKNTVILMTSNLAQSALNELLDGYVARWQELSAEAEAANGDKLKLADVKARKKQLSLELAAETKRVGRQVTTEAMKRAFKPEFEGRLSGPPIVFNRVTPEMAEQIVELNMRDLKGILARAGHELAWDKQVTDLLADLGFDIRLGARPLKNALDQHVTQTIARRVLEAARDNKGKVPPSKITAKVKDGKIAVDVAPLPAKKATKSELKDGTAADAVFTNVLTLSLKAASKQAVEPLTVDVIDSWIREALLAFPEEEQEAAPAAPAPSEEKKAAAANPEAPQPPKPAAPAAGLLKGGVKPALGPGAHKAKAKHFEYDLGDENVDAFRKSLADAMAAAGWDQASIDALTRVVEDPKNPYTGWLDQFVELAKTQNPADRRATPVTLAFELEGDEVKVVVHRNGTMDSREQDTLKRHFSGAAPYSAKDARDKAEAWVVSGKQGLRLMLDLHRQLAKLPGAAVGHFSKDGAGTDYWITLKKPAPPAPEPEIEPAIEESSAANDRPTPRPYGGMDVSRASQVPELEAAGEFRRVVSRTVTSQHDVDLHSAHASLAALFERDGYGRAAKKAAASFVDAGSDLIKTWMPAGGDARLEALWNISPAGARIMLRLAGHELSEANVQALADHFLLNAGLRAELEAGQVRVLVHSQDEVTSIWIELPAPTQTTAPTSAAATGKRFVVLKNDAEGTIERKTQIARATLTGIIQARGNFPDIARIEAFLAESAREAASLRGPDYVVEWRIEDGQLKVVAGYDGEQKRTYSAPVADEESTEAAAGAASSAGSSSNGARETAILNPRAENVDDQALQHALAQIAALNPGSSQRERRLEMIKKFVDRAARFGKEYARTENERLVLGWQVTRDHFEITLTRIRAQRFRAFSTWSDSVRDEPGYAELAAALTHELGMAHPRTGTGRHAEQIFLRFPLDARSLGNGDVTAAEALAKIVSGFEANEEGLFAVRFAQGLDFEREIVPLLERLGLAVAASHYNGTTDTKVIVRNAQASGYYVGQKAVDLALEPLVAAVDVPAAAVDAAANRVRSEGSRIDEKRRKELATASAIKAGRSGDPARDRAREIGFRIIGQNHERGATVRVAAADLLGEASTAADLAVARKWLKLRDKNLYAEMAAAANIVAKHGSREEDAEAVIDLLLWWSESGNSYGHEYNPTRRRLYDAFAALHETDNPEKVRELMADYAVAKANNSAKHLTEALYTALARNGDAQVRDLIFDDWNSHRATLLFDYLLEHDPDYLRGVYNRWAASRAWPDGVDRALLAWSIAHFGQASDLNEFMKLFRMNKFDFESGGHAGAALGSFLKRLNLYDGARGELRSWMNEDLDDDGTYTHVIAAVMASAENGDEQELPRLEEILKINPESHNTISNRHEVTQHEAAKAWARIIRRTGVITRYMTEQEPSAEHGLPPMPRIPRMLVATNGVVNKAALEAMRLLFLDAEPAAAPARPASPRTQNAPAPHPLFDWSADETGRLAGVTTTHGELDDPVFAGPTRVAIPPEASAVAAAWTAAFRTVGQSIFGSSFERLVRIAQTPSGQVSATWALEPVSGSIRPSAAQLTRLRELVYMLLHMTTETEDAAFRARLGRLELEVPGATAAFAALKAMKRPFAFRMGYDEAAAEFWLRLRFMRRASPPDGPGDPGSERLDPVRRPQSPGLPPGGGGHSGL